MLQINHILILFMFANFPYGLPDHRFMLQFILPAHPQAHEPSISPTISLPICEPTFISPTSYRNPPMGPPPSICFHQYLCPTRGTHFTLGHPFLYFVHLSQNYLLVIVQTPLFSGHFHFVTLVITIGDLLSCFGHMQPMSPLVGASLLIHPHWHRLYLHSTTQVTYHLSSEFVHLVPPLAQLILGLGIPLTLDLVNTVAATVCFIDSPAKGSLESSHFLTLSMYLCHRFTSVDSLKSFASRSCVSLLTTSTHFSKRATISYSSFPIQ
jgi:hypothetical protein